MKTNLFLALAAAAAITISGCSKKIRDTPDSENRSLQLVNYKFLIHMDSNS